MAASTSTLLALQGPGCSVTRPCAGRSPALDLVSRARRASRSLSSNSSSAWPPCGASFARDQPPALRARLASRALNARCSIPSSITSSQASASPCPARTRGAPRARAQHAPSSLLSKVLRSSDEEPGDSRRLRGEQSWRASAAGDSSVGESLDPSAFDKSADEAADVANREQPEPALAKTPSQESTPARGSSVTTEASTEGQNGSRIGRRSLAVFLPLLAAVSATSRAAAEVAAPELTLSPAPQVEVPDVAPSDVAPPPPDVAPPPAKVCPTKVRLSILEGCSLGVAFYPDFGYNPKGGGGEGVAEDLGNGKLRVTFDPKTLYIPPLSFDSTTFVGLPLPPPLRIRIVPSQLSGIIDRRTGRVDLTFKSQFFFTAGPIYSAPPLSVEAVLTTESSIGSQREGQGTRLDKRGQGTLVAVALVPPVADPFLDRFLTLPTDVLAVLPAQFAFSCE